MRCNLVCISYADTDVMHCDVSHVDVLMLHIKESKGLFSPVNQVDHRSGPYKLAGQDLFTYPEVPQNSYTCNARVAEARPLMTSIVA